MNLLVLAEQLEATAAELRAAHSADTETAALPFDGWKDWTGGDDCPDDARGKVVDVILRDHYEMSGPAAALDWGHNVHGDRNSGMRDVMRYRIAAEQPE
jgi:hypothetical protein